MRPKFRILCAAALGATIPAAAQGQQPPSTASALAPETQALVAEIERYARSDRDAEVTGFKAQLLDLLARVEADGRVPPRSRGELHTLLTLAAVNGQDVPAALAWLDKAEADYLAAGDARDKQAEVLHNRAALLRRERKLADAERAARRALALRRELYGPHHEDVASTLSVLANILYSQGRFEEAVETSREGVTIQEAVGPDDALRMVVRLDTLATMLDESGRSGEAVRIARREEALAREKLGTAHQWYGYAVNTLGQALLNQGMTEQAVPALRQTLDWRREHLGESHPYTASAMLVLSVALEESGRPEEANALAQAGLPVLQSSRDLMDANALAGFHHRVARIAAAMGDWDLYDARMAAGLAEVDAELPESNPSRAFLHVYHAFQLERRGRVAEALPIAEQWVPRLRTLIPQHNDRILGEMLLVRLRQLSGAAPADVVAQLGPVADALAGKLSALAASDRELARDARANSAAVLLYLETALAAGSHAHAFEAAQLVSMSDLSLAQQRTAGLGDADEATDPPRAAHRQLIEQARLARQLEVRQERARASGEDALAAELEPQVAAARAALGTGEAELRSRFPDYVARFRPSAVALEAFRGALAPGDLVLIPVEAQGRGFSLRITRDGGLVASRFDTAEVGALVDTLRDALSAPAEGASAFPFAASARLHDLLLPGGVPDGGRLLLHGGEKVASLPLAVLTTAAHPGPLVDAPWLVRRASVEVLGNLAAAPAATGVPSGAPRVAGIGGAALPAAGGAAGSGVAALFRSGLPEAGTIADLPPLPGAERELRAIAAAWPGGDDLILVGPDAFEERLKAADLSGARLLAFATHGLVSGEMAQVWEPALLVGTAPGSGEDGLLGASEIARLKLDADWVILSACNTAAGDSSGPAYSGLAAAFAQAGARALMLSHWRVRDDAAARLTVDTVKGAAAGLSRAEALRRAQLALMGDAAVPGAAHPAVWAPFVVVAD